LLIAISAKRNLLDQQWQRTQVAPTMSQLQPDSTARPAAVAGLFYPADAAALRAQIESFLDACGQDDVRRVPKLVIVPHAGFMYSGAVAARAYARLRLLRDRIRRVVLIGPAHRVAVQGLAVPSVAAFDTPLGRIPLDRAALADLGELAPIVRDDAAHADEHALEVQLPFLQLVLDRFALVPLVVGDARADAVAQVLERLWGGDETLIVISSDLSHYLASERARMVDASTAQRILALDARLDYGQACGAIGINGALAAARRHDLLPRLLDLRNSGDVTGDPRRVVGYGAFAFESRS
jgi:AmmeMemoRadiSam system protein B